MSKITNSLNLEVGLSGQCVRVNTDSTLSPCNVETVGNEVLIDTKTASNSPDLQFLTGINSTYNIYYFELDSILAASASNLLLEVTTNGGVSWDSTSGNYIFSTQLLSMASTPSTTGSVGSSTTGTNIQLTVGNDNATTIQMIISMADPNAAEVTFIYNGTFYNGTSYFNSSGAGAYKAAAINGVRFRFSSGNITSGSIKLYARGAIN